MILEPAGELATPGRLPTGIEGLDEVLQGALVRGGSTLIIGEPGAGKTTLGNQLANNHARSGGVAVVVTALAESHDRTSSSLSGFRFFDRERLGSGVYYVSLNDELGSGGLTGALELLRKLVRSHKPTLLVIDGASRFADFAGRNEDYRQFASDLYAQQAALDCTTVLLSIPGRDLIESVATLADSLVFLDTVREQARDFRVLHVQKFRGASFLSGLHAYEIGNDGLVVYPRLEARQAAPDAARTQDPHRMSLGVAGLDEMLGGGVRLRSATLVAGSLGVDATAIGLHFIGEGATRGESGLMATVHNTNDHFVEQAESLGIGISSHIASGLVRVLRYPTLEILLDDWGNRLLRSATDDHRQRVLIDGLADLQRLSAFQSRFPAYLAALTVSLSEVAATVLMTANLMPGDRHRYELPEFVLSGALQNIVLLRSAGSSTSAPGFITVVKSDLSHDGTERQDARTALGIGVASAVPDTDLSREGPASSCFPGASCPKMTPPEVTTQLKQETAAP